MCQRFADIKQSNLRSSENQNHQFQQVRLQKYAYAAAAAATAAAPRLRRGHAAAAPWPRRAPPSKLAPRVPQLNLRTFLHVSNVLGGFNRF